MASIDLEELQKQSGVVNAAQNYLNNAIGGQPSYTQNLSNLYNQIMSRPSFQFDLGSNKLYQQYRDRYIKQGQMAMKDTVGQASALTGGYGSTYAEQVGQQSYEAYLDKLNDVIPDLYAQERAEYDAEGTRLLNAYNLANSDRQQAYANLKSAIASAGYSPTDEELDRSGMTRDEAAAWRNYYEQALAAASGGGGGGGYGGGYDYGDDEEEEDTSGYITYDDVKNSVNASLLYGDNATAIEKVNAAYNSGAINQQQRNSLMWSASGMQAETHSNIVSSLAAQSLANAAANRTGSVSSPSGNASINIKPSPGSASSIIAGNSSSPSIVQSGSGSLTAKQINTIISKLKKQYNGGSTSFAVWAKNQVNNNSGYTAAQKKQIIAKL